MTAATRSSLTRGTRGRPLPATGRHPRRRGPHRAAVAATRAGRGADGAGSRPVCPRGDRHRAGGGRPDGRPRLVSPRGRVASFPGWETLPHERLSPQSDTVGRRIAVLRRLAHPAGAGQSNGPLAVVVAPVRSLLQPIVAGLGDLEPVSLQAGQDCELDDLLARLVEIGYSRADLVSAAARSPSAAASWTSSRPPRNTRCGSSSSATRSRRSATSRSLTSAASAAPTTGCGRRRAGNCCSPRRSGTAPRNSPTPIRRWPTSSASWPRAYSSRAWRRSRPCSPTGWTCWSTTYRRAASCWPAIPSGSGLAPRNWSGRARSSSRRPGRTPRSARRRPSTSGRRPSSRSRGSARPRRRWACPGGRSRRSA